MPSYFAITCYIYIFVLSLLAEPLNTVIYVITSTTYVPHTGTVDYFEKWILQFSHHTIECRSYGDFLLLNWAPYWVT